MNKQMNLEEKIELIKAAGILADFWGVRPADLLTWAAIENKEKVAKWNKINAEVISFYKAPFEKRAEMLGIKLQKNKEAREK